MDPTRWLVVARDSVAIVRRLIGATVPNHWRFQMRRIITTLVMCAVVVTLPGFQSHGTRAQEAGIKFWAYSNSTPFRGVPSAHVLIRDFARLAERIRLAKSPSP